MSSETIKNSGKNLAVLIDEAADDYELTSRACALKMLLIYKDAKKSVSGNSEQRQIGRMRIVLDAFLEELKEAVERAEQESM
jgi:hypothetical protein